jgi:apolipoprotein N-acyltransferase
MTWLGTVASALLYGAAFPTTAVRPLAWVALIPFLVGLRRVGSRTAVALGWVWAVCASGVVSSWFAHAVAVYYQQPLAVGIGFFFGVATFTAGLHYMAFSWCYRRLARHPGPTLPLLAAAAWVTAELGRVKLLGGDPWALAGYSQAGFTPLMQIADLTGVYGITFVLVAVNAALADLWLAADPTARRVARRGLGLAIGTVGVVLGYGVFRLSLPAEATTDGPETPIAIVQGNVDQGSQWRSEFYGQNLELYLRLTYRALKDSRPTLVFWPESAMTFFLDTEPLYQRSIALVVAAGGAELVAGGPRMVDGEQPHYYNSAFLLSRRGEIAATYDKQLLLPFAEYFPLPSLDFLRRRFGRVREFTAGSPTPPLPTVAGRAGVVTCNEAMFPDLAAARVRAGAEYLVNLANDSWVADTKFSALTFDMVLLRAIEQRRYLVRASTSGPSAIVDPFGHVQVRSDANTQAVLSGHIRPAHGLTPYARLGDAFALACALAVAAALVATTRR